MADQLEKEVAALARRIAELGAGEQSKVFRMSWWSERLLDWAMSDPDFKTQLFRLVDVFPATTNDDDVMRHLREYFDEVDAPRALDLGIGAAARIPFGRSVSARVARRNITRMAQQFIVGATADDAVEGLHRQWRDGSAFTIDLLGEKTITEAEADRYADRVEEMIRTLATATAKWATDDHLERDDSGPLPRVNVSIKPTALATHYEPLTREQGREGARQRLRPILRAAREVGASINFDMEHYGAKDITLELFRGLLDEHEFGGIEAGTVIQSYLRDSYSDLLELIEWSGRRTRPITIRLVKGAYWDTETVRSRAAGWPVPVFEHKEETDANFDRCTRALHDNHDRIRAAFGSHNLRSLAYAATYARSLGIPDHGYEIQMLYGMAEPIHAAIRRMGFRLRVYAPVGDLVPGMAYLVRRLLENTANESFVRHRFAEGRSLEALLAPPHVERIPEPEPATRRQPTRAEAPSPYTPEPVAEWRRASVRSSFAAAVESVAGELDREVPGLIGNEEIHTTQTIVSVDPAEPDTVVATSASCGAAEADAAVSVARDAGRGWRETPPSERAAVLFRTAEWMRSRRMRLAALEVFEAGKPWDQADADITEAIDFCEYYAREILRLSVGGRVQSPPGETNDLRYGPKGIGVVIAPWNFPLAIPTGMTVAALAAGNPVILKPAEQTPAIAAELVQGLRDSGLPTGAIAFLPGLGEEVGARLVEHPEVNFIIFTGSMAVGLEINRIAAIHRPGQRHVKRVVAEMGGKNALIVDADADPDQAVPAIISSAFGFTGQKCSATSRLIVVGRVYDQILDRVVAAARALRVGHPRDMGVQVGPLIDEDAQQRVLSYVGSADQHGRVALVSDEIPDTGYFAGPAVVADVDPESPLARDEIFGPVLSVMKADDFDHALELANRTDYALTAGIFSRSPVHIRRAAATLRAGNVYVNRSTTGAVVGRQPFGGYGLSGVGSKAGGPDYLLQFLDPRVVTENTLRQGFAPPSPEQS